MKPKYAVFKTNRNQMNDPFMTAGTDSFHVRLVPAKTITGAEIARDLANESPFREEVTLSMFSLLAEYVTRKTGEGNIVRIEGLGSFMPVAALKAPITDPEKVLNSLVYIRDLKFVADREMLRRLRYIPLQRDYDHGNTQLSADNRRQRILDYMDRHIETGYNPDFLISRRTAMELNRCSQHTASDDLSRLIEEKMIKMVGSGNRILYKRIITKQLAV